MNKDTDFIQLQHESLVLRGLYFYRKEIRQNGKHVGFEYVPVEIVGHARRGDYGDRVIGNDGVTRYSGGGFVGRHRAYENRATDLYWKLKPGVQYIKPAPPRPAEVQLDLFDTV